MSTVDRYIRDYIRRKRLVEMGCLFLWMVDFLLVWLWLKSGHPVQAKVFGMAPAICFCGLSLFSFIRKISDLTAATEIESRVPAFDQRLITAVSIAETSPLVNQLMEETDAIILQSRHISLVSFRQWIPPAVIGLGQILTYHVIH